MFDLARLLISLQLMIVKVIIECFSLPSFSIKHVHNYNVYRNNYYCSLKINI